MKPTLDVRWVPLRVARAFVADHHRHLPRVAGGVLALGVFDGARLCGVAILGRPSARMLDTGHTMELVRCATDGTDNAGSALYGRARRVAHALGMSRLVTYTLSTESGASLRGAGWVSEGQAGGGEWSRPARKRTQARHAEPKQRWSAR